MRGKDIASTTFDFSKRITPAYAGKRSLNADEAYPDRDHPRLCGEKANKTIKTANAEGSPPPMRGKVPETVV